MTPDQILALLALLADMQTAVTQLQHENAQLRAAVAAAATGDDAETGPARPPTAPDAPVN